MEVMDAERELLLFGSLWSPPAWTKTNGMFNSFLESYKAEGAPIWGITSQNEPSTGFVDYPFNICAWTPEDMRDWIIADLGPALEAAAGLR